MTKQFQTNNSSYAAKRYSLRQLLRSAIAAGVVAGFVGSASAQEGLVLPMFPSDEAATLLPVSQDAVLPMALPGASPTAVPVATRVGMLLGLKKRPTEAVQTQSNSTQALPAFPSTASFSAAQQGEPLQLSAPQAHAPSISLSTGANSMGTRLQLSDAHVVPAGADEALSPETNESSLIVQEEIVQEETASESLVDALSEVLVDGQLVPDSGDESLTDIAIPPALTPPSPVTKQRQPELVKRPPVMQLHIGGGATASMSSSESTNASATVSSFSLSDEAERPTSKPASQLTEQPAAPKILNVKIEGEPAIAQVVARTPVVQESPLVPQVVEPELVSPLTKSKTPTDKVPETVPTEAASVAKSPVERPAVGKTVAERLNDRSAVMGERLDVGLHECTNVDTTNPISGLSVEHPELCQVLKSSERSVSLVGLKPGQTRVALFTTNASGERKIEIREVTIAGAENRQADMKSLATEIGRSIHRMYPNSHIEVIAEAEGLTVQGYAGSEDEAKKIIGLVRRTSLQPVVDRLATYK